MVEDIENLISGTFQARRPAIMVKDIDQTLDYIIETNLLLFVWRWRDGFNVREIYSLSSL